MAQIDIQADPSEVKPDAAGENLLLYCSIKVLARLLKLFGETLK
jgi:hypothetical protein